ncbi:DUF6622 family protein [Jiella mangrovi]|uniref:Uncharacterized protein n=1 Tax=Jiella mangrovi TaxID=2821407 RepID=A0ABS4BBF5_9HYPH|nr:DUF6622 family protein [Jiella mangrovi]MBP0614081.1 hypothetical protein [Jiella mangrovi]
MPHSILDIVAGTPFWVWLVLVLCVALGLSSSRPRTVSVRRLLVRPLALFAVSAYVLFAGGSAGHLAVAVWVLAVAAGASLAFLRARQLPVHPVEDAPGKVAIGGDLLPLVAVLALFVIDYGFGVLSSLDPALTARPEVPTMHAALGGLFGGLFVGRGLTLFWRAQPLAQAA